MEKFLKMNLQYFGDEGEQDPPQEPSEEKNDDEPFTMDDVKKLLQSETDKIRTEYSKKLKQKEKEFENFKKEKMTDEEKKKYEFEQLQSQLSEKEKSLNAKEMTLFTIDALKENSLPLEAKDFLLGSDQESTLNNINAFKQMFDSAVTNAVETTIKSTGKEHKKGDGSPKTYTHEMVSKMSTSEINANWDQIQKDLGN